MALRNSTPPAPIDGPDNNEVPAELRQAVLDSFATDDRLKALASRLPGGEGRNHIIVICDFLCSEYGWPLDHVAGLDNGQMILFVEQALRRREQMRLEAGPMMGTPAGPAGTREGEIGTRSADEPREALTDNEYTVLRGLRDKRPRLVLLDDLAAETGIARKACGQIVKSLIARGLAERPRERQGATITHAGEALLSAADAPR